MVECLWRISCIIRWASPIRLRATKNGPKVKATGMRGVVRYTTHDARTIPQIVYVLAYPGVSNLCHNRKYPRELVPEVPLSDPDVLAYAG